MDILWPMRIRASLSTPSLSAIANPFFTSSSHPSSFLRTFCTRKPSPQNNAGGDNDDEDGDDGSTSRGDTSRDWDKAWSRFWKQGGKTSSKFSPDKYVSWNPRPSNYPLSEEVDPIKRTERSNLSLWTSQTFTLAGAVTIITLLLIYTLLVPVK